jgi:putative spermidine/putrescine transport system substrate-binding protein
MTSSSTLAQDEPVTLVVSTFGFNLDVIEENVTRPFEEMYNVDVVYETGNNAERLTRLESLGEESDVDVVHFAGAYTQRAKEAGLLQPIDPEMLENYDELYEWAQDPLGDNAGIAYAVNSYLLMYRPDLIDEPLTSWADLLRDDLAGYVTVPDITTTFGPATLIMLNRALTADSEATPEAGEAIQIDYEAEAAWEALPDLAENLVTTYRVSSEMVTLVQQEEAWAAPYASFTISNLLDTGLEIERVVPKEGIIGDPIVVSITATADNVELAHQYIDWIISHDVQEAEALDLIDSPTNMTVELPEDICVLLTCGEELIDNLIFLDQAVVEENLDAWIERWNEIMLQ